MLLRQSNNGPVVTGNAPGDALLWDAVRREWFPGAIPIPPPFSLVPLSNTFYVDPGSTAAGTPDGSIAHPYKTAQAAYDAHQALTLLALVFTVGSAGDLIIPATAPAGGVLVLCSYGGGGGNLNSVLPTIGTLTCNAGFFSLAASNMNLQTVQDGHGDPPAWTGPIVLDSCTGNTVNAQAATVELSRCDFATEVAANQIIASVSELPGALNPRSQLLWDGETEQRTFGNVDIPVVTFLIPVGSVVRRIDDAAPTALIADDADQTGGGRLVFTPGRLTADRTVSLPAPIPARPTSAWIDVWPQAHALTIVDALVPGSTYTVAAGEATRLIWTINTNDVAPTWRPFVIQPLAT